MGQLLDLRHKSERPVHLDELRHVSYIACAHVQKGCRLWRKDEGLGAGEPRPLRFLMWEEIPAQDADATACFEVSEDDDGDVTILDVDCMLRYLLLPSREEAHLLHLQDAASVAGTATANPTSTAAAGTNAEQLVLPEPAKSVEALLAKIVKTLPSTAALWVSDE